jgi:Ca2+/Na+ antiporter
LKERLLSTVLVMLAVTFLGYAVTWDKDISIIGIGVGVALVIGTVAYTIKMTKEAEKDNDKTEKRD